MTSEDSAFCSLLQLESSDVDLRGDGASPIWVEDNSASATRARLRPATKVLEPCLRIYRFNADGRK
jgi:hypothetical protein